jgi:hypothetical protein
MDQIEIIQNIVNSAISAAEPGWSELKITYHIGDGHSEFGNSYLIAHNGVIREKALPVSLDLDSWMRRLQGTLVELGGQAFTACKLHLHANGKFEVFYGYDAVDWDGLVTAGWNFPEVTSLH